MKTKRKPKVKIVVGKAGPQKGNIYFKIYGGNGELICSSEGYTSKAKVKNGIYSTWSALNHWVIKNSFNKFNET